MLIIRTVKDGKVLIASDDKAVISVFINAKLESALRRIKDNERLSNTEIYQPNLVDRLNSILTEKTDQVVMLESLMELHNCVVACYNRDIQIKDVNFYTSDNKYQLVTVEG